MTGKDPLVPGVCTQPQDENLIVTHAFDSLPAASRATMVKVSGERAQSTLLGVPRKVPAVAISNPVPAGSPNAEKEILPIPPTKYLDKSKLNSLHTQAHINGMELAGVEGTGKLGVPPTSPPPPT